MSSNILDHSVFRSLKFCLVVSATAEDGVGWGGIGGDWQIVHFSFFFSFFVFAHLASFLCMLKGHMIPRRKNNQFLSTNSNGQRENLHYRSQTFENIQCSPKPLNPIASFIPLNKYAPKEPLSDFCPSDKRSLAFELNLTNSKKDTIVS